MRTSAGSTTCARRSSSAANSARTGSPRLRTAPAPAPARRHRRSPTVPARYLRSVRGSRPPDARRHRPGPFRRRLPDPSRHLPEQSRRRPAAGPRCRPDPAHRIRPPVHRLLRPAGSRPRHHAPVRSTGRGLAHRPPGRPPVRRLTLVRPRLVRLTPVRLTLVRLRQVRLTLLRPLAGPGRPPPRLRPPAPGHPPDLATGLQVGRRSLPVRRRRNTATGPRVDRRSRLSRRPAGGGKPARRASRPVAGRPSRRAVRPVGVGVPDPPSRPRVRRAVPPPRCRPARSLARRPARSRVCRPGPSPVDRPAPPRISPLHGGTPPGGPAGFRPARAGPSRAVPPGARRRIRALVRVPLTAPTPT